MKKKRPTWIPVVTGLLTREGKVLVGQRPQDGSLAGQWEFPGGKIEMGESPEKALHRELSEELGIDAEIGPLKFACSHAYGITGIILLFYEVKYWKGQIKPVHHTEIKWVAVKDLPGLPVPEANSKVMSRIIEVLE